MSQELPKEHLILQKRKITIIVAECPKCKGDMWPRKPPSRAKRIYSCMNCGYQCEAK